MEALVIDGKTAEDMKILVDALMRADSNCDMPEEVDTLVSLVSDSLASSLASGDSFVPAEDAVAMSLAAARWQSGYGPMKEKVANAIDQAVRAGLRETGIHGTEFCTSNAAIILELEAAGYAVHRNSYGAVSKVSW